MLECGHPFWMRLPMRAPTVTGEKTNAFRGPSRYVTFATAHVTPRAVKIVQPLNSWLFTKRVAELPEVLSGAQALMEKNRKTHTQCATDTTACELLTHTCAHR